MDYEASLLTREEDEESGLRFQTVDFRSVKEQDCFDTEPTVDGVWIDEEFPPNVAIEDFEQKSLQWKRPVEFRENPVLFSEGTTRFDIEQGALGTCWFLAMVANLSEHPQLLKKVIREGDYDPSRGIFHCRFWKFGVWEDVYIDDHLPVIYDNRIWSARSATDNEEMWVSLLEKGFAKLHGSYNATCGGFASDAYLELTGGIAESLNIDNGDLVPHQFFQRVKNALQTGALVTCTVPGQFHDKNGLVGNHVYSLTAAKRVDFTDQGTECLLRVRNPWGNTEWTGPWSDGSEEWNSIPADSIERVNIDDGEFWISLQDFLSYFSNTTICSLTPDFDMDGCADSLNNVLRIYGQWLGETAAGFKDKLKNPKYIFAVPDEGMAEDGFVHVVIQLIQKTQHRKTDKVSIRCDLYKVLGQQDCDGTKYVLESIGTNTQMYMKSLQTAFRHKIEPGLYAVVPSTLDPGLEKEFLIRIFTSCSLNTCSEIPRNSVLMLCDPESSTEIEGNTAIMTSSETHFGAWVAGRNAGGQVSKRDTHHLNPQYTFTVPDTGESVPVAFHLMQSQEGPQYPVGLRVYSLDMTHQPPVDMDYLLQHYGSCPEPAEGRTFVFTWDLDVKYALTPGHYMVILHMDEPDTEKEFALHARSSEHLDIRGFQTGL